MKGQLNGIFRILLAIVLAMAAMYAAEASAQEYLGRSKVNRVISTGTGYTLFGTDIQGPNTCDYYLTYYRFDSSTAAGKNMTATVLMARATGQLIDVWYSASTAPGTNQSNGCYEFNIAVPSMIGISQNQ